MSTGNVSDDALQVLHLAVARARAQGKEKMNVRTTTIADLGGIDMLPASMKKRWIATPEAGKDALTGEITVYAMEQLLANYGGGQQQQKPAKPATCD